MNTPTACEERVAPGVRVSYDAARVLYRVKSSAHEKLVIENARFGRLMMIDGVVQFSTADEFIYHEMMAHVPVLAHGRAERVLIIGGGDCGLAEEVLKHRDVERLVQVESDPQVVKLGRSYFSDINAPVFRDSRFSLEIGDGAAFVAATEERFDLILVDPTNPEVANHALSSEGFYRNARGCLAAGGLLIAQLGVPFLQPLQFAASMTRLARLFPVASCYLVPVPCIYGGPIAFGWGSNVLSPDALDLHSLVARFRSARIDTRYYTPAVHRASFALPAFIKSAVDGQHPYAGRPAIDVTLRAVAQLRSDPSP